MPQLSAFLSSSTNSFSVARPNPPNVAFSSCAYVSLTPLIAGLEVHTRDPGFDQNTVRDSEKVNRITDGNGRLPEMRDSPKYNAGFGKR